MPSCGATRHMKTVAAKKMASDNVFRVGASFRTFVEMQNALRLFEQQTHSQFYMRRPNIERGKENDAKRSDSDSNDQCCA